MLLNVQDLFQKHKHGSLNSRMALTTTKLIIANPRAAPTRSLLEGKQKLKLGELISAKF